MIVRDGSYRCRLRPRGHSRGVVLAFQGLVGLVDRAVNTRIGAAIFAALVILAIGWGAK